MQPLLVSFYSVVVITSAYYAEGLQFDPGWKQWVTLQKKKLPFFKNANFIDLGWNLDESHLMDIEKPNVLILVLSRLSS